MDVLVQRVVELETEVQVVQGDSEVLRAELAKTEEASSKALEAGRASERVREEAVNVMNETLQRGHPLEAKLKDQGAEIQEAERRIANLESWLEQRDVAIRERDRAFFAMQEALRAKEVELHDIHEVIRLKTEENRRKDLTTWEREAEIENRHAEVSEVHEMWIRRTWMTVVTSFNNVVEQIYLLYPEFPEERLAETDCYKVVMDRHLVDPAQEPEPEPAIEVEEKESDEEEEEDLGAEGVEAACGGVDDEGGRPEPEVRASDGGGSEFDADGRVFPAP